MLPSLDWNARFTPPEENSERGRYEFVVEGLRGLAALEVCYSQALHNEV